MAHARFSGREELAQDPINILTNIVEFLDLALFHKREILDYMKEDEVISTMYWLLDINDDTTVEYKTFTPTDGSLGKVTAKARQAVTYMAFCSMTGYAYELSEKNETNWKKRWSNGLALENVSDLLEDEVNNAIWDTILRLKDAIYARVDRRTVILTRFINTKKAPPQQPTLKTVFTQLEVLFDLINLKTVQRMLYFITSSNPDLLLPNVRRDALAFKAAYDKVISEEGTGFNTCRLIEHNKHPDLLGYKYPDLYAATLEWVRNLRAPKNPKAITDRAINPDLTQNGSSQLEESE